MAKIIFIIIISTELNSVESAKNTKYYTHSVHVQEIVGMSKLIEAAL